MKKKLDETKEKRSREKTKNEGKSICVNDR